MIAQNDISFMTKLNGEAEKLLKRGDYPAACVIVKDGTIISKGISDGVEKNDCTSHAELNAIKKACKKLKNRFLEECVLYTNIELCLMCGKAIVYAKINKVIYGVKHGEYGNKKTFEILKNNGIGKDIEIIAGVEEERASKLLNHFLKMKIRI